MKEKIVVLFIIAIMLVSCASTKEKQYIVMSSKVFDVLVPKYLAYVEIKKPNYEKVKSLVEKKAPYTSNEKLLIADLLKFLDSFLVYNNKEKEIIKKSYLQLQKTAKIARRNAEKE